MKRWLALVLVLFSPSLWAASMKVTLNVKGMTCPLCVVSINQVLRQTEGVIKAKASLKTEQAEVIVPEGYDTKKLLAAVEKTGYTGSIATVEKLVDAP